MPVDDLIGQILKSWQIHNGIHLTLLSAIPAEGFVALPLNSRGRSVGRQFVHMNEVRVGWVRYHQTGQRPNRTMDGKAEPDPAILRPLFEESGETVAAHLEKALRGGAKVRMFGGNPMRWMGYLVSHESHHRGQIALALKQNGMRLPEKVAMEGLWQQWFFGKG